MEMTEYKERQREEKTHQTRQDGTRPSALVLTQNGFTDKTFH